MSLLHFILIKNIERRIRFFILKFWLLLILFLFITFFPFLFIIASTFTFTSALNNIDIF